jgi:hypothetical protein
MTLIQCSKCGRETSDKAKACPWGKLGTLAHAKESDAVRRIILVLLLAVAAIAAGCQKSDRTPPAAPVSVKAELKERTAPPDEQPQSGDSSVTSAEYANHHGDQAVDSLPSSEKSTTQLSDQQVTELRRQIAANPALAASASVAPKPVEDVDQLLQRLPKGAVAYNAPKEMSLGELTTIQVVLSHKLAPEDLKALVEPAGEKVSARIKVSDRMTAQLSGDGFDIHAVEPEMQAISMKDVTKWEWEVKPKKSGKHALHLTISVMLTVDGQPTPRVLESYHSDINVKVSVPQQIAEFAGANWKWLWSTLLLPVVGWGWHRYRRPQGQKAD